MSILSFSALFRNKTNIKWKFGNLKSFCVSVLFIINICPTLIFSFSHFLYKILLLLLWFDANKGNIYFISWECKWKAWSTKIKIIKFYADNTTNFPKILKIMIIFFCSSFQPPPMLGGKFSCFSNFEIYISDLVVNVKLRMK